MFLRAHHREKDGKRHTYWSLVETVRTPDGPRQRIVCHLGELNDSAQRRWLKTIEVFNEAGERRQLKLFPADTPAPSDDRHRVSAPDQPGDRRGTDPARAARDQQFHGPGYYLPAPRGATRCSR